MSTKIRDNLAAALERISTVAEKSIVRSSDMSRTDRSVLQQRGYLTYIMKGWYFLSTPTDMPGESTAWYSVFWDFLFVYLKVRFGDDYCLSATSSLDVHLGNNIIPSQVIVTTGRGGKTLLELPYNVSLLVYEEKNGISKDVTIIDGLRVMPFDLVLCRLPNTYFVQQAIDAEIAIRSLSSVTPLVRRLLSGPYIAAAQRLAGAYEFIGKPQWAEEITMAMKAAGHICSAKNPFTESKAQLTNYNIVVSPYAARIAALFSSMAPIVEEEFAPLAIEDTLDKEKYLKHIDDIYVDDAYNSLSIEGYQVTPDLIERIRSGQWDPEHRPEDLMERNAMAAKGYLDAFRLVKKTVGDIIDGASPVEAVIQDYGKWYMALFSASVQSGILEAYHLAGFRADRVFIRGSRHVPPPSSALLDSMQFFFDEMQGQTAPGVRAVMGHFAFTFIHPYMDGNGRIARFLMNTMMAASGLPWTVIHVASREEYMRTLEIASCENNIRPFARFIKETQTLKG